MKNLAYLGILLILGVARAPACAQGLSDPTRPPASFGSEVGDGASEGPVLQSILRSNLGKPGAIISGEYVMLGGRVGEARLIKIGEDSVTLKTTDGTETLMLVPGVEKSRASDGLGREPTKTRRDRKEVNK